MGERTEREKKRRKGGAGVVADMIFILTLLQVFNISIVANTNVALSVGVTYCCKCLTVSTQTIQCWLESSEEALEG